MTIVELRVHIYCSGCETKLKKALLKLDGVNDVDTNMRMQKVVVTGIADQSKVLKTLRKIGMRAEPWTVPYNAQYHDFDHFYKQQMSFVQTANPCKHHKMNGNVVHVCTYDCQPKHNGDASFALFNDDNPSGCFIM